MDRRSLLRGVAALGGAAMMPPFLSASGSGQPDLETLGERTGTLEAALASGTAQALADLERHAADLARLYSDRPSPELAGVVAHAAERAGLALLYGAWTGQAEQWAMAGRALAEDAGDLAQHARCTTLMACALTDQGQAEIALRVLGKERKLKDLPGWSLVGIEAQTARAAAAAGQPYRTRQALGEMAAAAARATGPPPAGWWPQNSEALAFLELGQVGVPGAYAEAEDRLRLLAARHEQDPLLLAQFSVGLAEASAAAGRVDEACALGVAAADVLAHSPCRSELRRLDRLRRSLPDGSRHVRDLDAALVAAMAG